jgi:hypothetical protein
MTKAIQRAVAHFKSLSVKTFEVSEWADDEGKPLVIYVEPFTLKDKTRLQVAARTGSEIDALVELIVLKCLDSKGEHLFTIEDKPLLRMNVDANVLERISQEIMRVDVEGIRKN